MADNRLIGRSNSRKHYHEQSMDDFMKNLRKFNLKSQRYISNRPFNMYLRQNTTKTIEKSRSRTLSNRKSQSKSKKVRKKVENLLSEESGLKPIKEKRKHETKPTQANDKNVAELIEYFSEKIKKVQKYLENKNQVGLLLCHRFTEMLNQIVEATIVQLNNSIKEVEKKTVMRIQRQYKSQIRKLTNYTNKLELRTKQLLDRLQNNSTLLYHIRMNTDLDIDYIFGRVALGTEKCGGRGYNNQSEVSYQYPESEKQSGEKVQSGRIRPAIFWKQDRVNEFSAEKERKSF